MILLLFALGLIEAAQPASQSQVAAPTASQQQARDVYTECFLRELSVLEKRDVENTAKKFSAKNANQALKHCQKSKALLVKQVEAELAADPAFADNKLRSLELDTRVRMTELSLLLLIRFKGK